MTICAQPLGIFARLIATVSEHPISLSRGSVGFGAFHFSAAHFLPVLYRRSQALISPPGTNVSITGIPNV
jgi:hypothetical protein